MPKIRLKGKRAKVQKLRRHVADDEYLNSKFVGSRRKGKKIKHFHRPDCKWAVDYLRPPNLVEFDSHEEAVATGYKPCKTCCA